MKIQFPARFTGGKRRPPLDRVNLDTATNRAVIALQMQTGWKLSEIRGNAETHGGVMAQFLTLHTAGYSDVTWDDLLDATRAEVVYIPEARDIAAIKAAAEKEAAKAGGAQGEAGPEASPRDADKPVPRKAATRSSKKSPGSKTR